MSAIRCSAPFAFVLLFHVFPAAAQSSFQHSGQALTHSLEAIGESMMAGTKLVSGVAAVPLKASAAVGELSGEMGDALWDAANAPVGQPLPVTEDVITIGPPPGAALQNGGQTP